MKHKGGNKNPRRKKEWLRMETFKRTRYGEHIHHLTQTFQDGETFM